MISDKLREDMKAAMKAGDKARLSVIRLLLADLKYARIARGEDLSEAEEEKVLASFAKKRKEAIEAYRGGGRDEMADKEQAEHDMCVAYLPEQLGDDEVRALIRDAVEATGANGPKDFGLVMKKVMESAGSRADGKTVSALVREILNG